MLFITFSCYLSIYMKLKSLSCVRFFVTPWTVAHQASLSMGFCRQECWSGLPFLQGIFPTQGSNPSLRHCRRMLYQLNHQGRYVVVLFIFTPDIHSLYFLFFLMSLTRKFSFNNLFKELIFFPAFSIVSSISLISAVSFHTACLLQFYCFMRRKLNN